MCNTKLLSTSLYNIKLHSLLLILESVPYFMQRVYIVELPLGATKPPFDVILVPLLLISCTFVFVYFVSTSSQQKEQKYLVQLLLQQLVKAIIQVRKVMRRSRCILIHTAVWTMHR